MTDTEYVQQLAESLANVAPTVDQQIGENRNYGEGLGPYDEDDQIEALVNQARENNLLEPNVYTVDSDASEVRYPSGKEADIVIQGQNETVYLEAKLFRFEKGNGDPSEYGFARVFNPFQDRAGQSFIHDVNKIAESEIRATKALLGIYYRPTDGPCSDVTSEQMAEKFAEEVNYWTDRSITANAVATFSELQHTVHSRGGILTWQLDNQPETWV